MLVVAAKEKRDQEKAAVGEMVGAATWAGALAGSGNSSSSSSKRSRRSRRSRRRTIGGDKRADNSSGSRHGINCANMVHRP